MTFSVVARSGDGSSWGVAVASKYPAAAATVAAAAAGHGALATQAGVEIAYKPRGLALLAHGTSARQVVLALTDPDPDAAVRQVGVVDAAGESATFTGAECMPWAGGRTGPGYAIQGNILVGEQVVVAMQQAWLDGDPGAMLAHRLVDALVAGDAAGGDRRGRQSAGVLVASTEPGPQGGGPDATWTCDLRVDDHPQAVTELVRLLGLHDLHFGRPDPATLLPLTGDLGVEVHQRLEHLGHRGLDDWAGVENYENRLVAGAIDPLVLAALRAAGSTPRH
jgi:uncharacterized Ntn-hydrolase superfamily protein